MKNKNWSKLQSGTDIRGTALEDADNEVDLTKEVIKTVGKSFISWLTKNVDKNKENLKVAIGFDSRLTADKLKKYLADSITDFGVDVFICGLASTPAMFMSTIMKGHQYDGAIMITASHMPYDKNGLKFFTKQGGLEKNDIKKLLEIAQNKSFKLNANQKGTVNKVNLIDDYCQDIKKIIRNRVEKKADRSRPLAGFNIIVDAGNGAGGFFVDKILKPLGADTSGSQFLEPNGHFPNHIPNPENKEAMKAIKNAVIESQADLGIIFDTDVDRAAVVDDNGQSINKNKLIALASTIVLEETPQAYIVTDSVTSSGLKPFIEKKLGGHHHRFKRGYKNVINEAKRLENENKNAPLAIETSGHAAFKENYFLDDGAYLIAKILIKMANMNVDKKGIGDLISDLEEAEIKKEYRMTINLDEFKEYGQQVLKNLKSYIKNMDHYKLAPKNYEGVRIECGKNDWFLLRMSLHDPVLVLNIECDDKDSLNSIKKDLKNFLKKYKKLNLKSLS